MTDVTPPYTPPPDGVPPGPGFPPPAPGEVPPPRKGLSTGVKVAIGCGVLLLLVLVLMGICFGVVGKKVADKAEDMSAAMEDQEEASRTAEELEREHAFTPPADGVLDEELVDKFFAVTDDAWENMKEWAQDMEDRAARLEKEGSEAGVGDALAGVQGLGRARVTLAEALDKHDMSPSAYVWTGFKLVEAHDAQASGGGTAVPEKNLEIARAHADELAELKEEEGEEADKGVVLGIAFMLYPQVGAMVPAGMDTLFRQGGEPVGN